MKSIYFSDFKCLSAKCLLLQVQQQQQQQQGRQFHNSLQEKKWWRAKKKEKRKKKDMQHFSVGLASDVDIFLNLGGETVTSITTEKTATAKKSQAACDSPGREKKADWMLSYRDEYKKQENQLLYWPNISHKERMWEIKQDTNSKV